MKELREAQEWLLAKAPRGASASDYTGGPHPKPLTGREQAVAAGWLSRAIVSGFVASAVMLFGFIIAYALATLVAGVLANQRSAEVVRGWLHALTHNTVLDLSLASLYVAVAVYFAGGLLWALLYARFGATYLRGPDWWRGVVFSVLPAAISLLIVLPLLGGGLLGLRLGAGPFPLMGNLLLHVLYGATLGLLYGSFGDRSAEDWQPASSTDFQAMATSERMAARIGLVGGLIGVVIGLIALAFSSRDGGTVLGVSPAAFMLSTVVSGLALGGLAGSLVGLPSARSKRV